MRLLFSLTLFFCFIQPIHAIVRFLTISDIHYGHDNTPGSGHDTDDVLLASAMRKFNHLTHQSDFIIALGDFPTHMLRSSPKREIYIQRVFHELYKADDQGKPMFYVTGNNDSLKGNYQPFSWNNRSPLTLALDWQGACAHCKGLLIDDSHMGTGGYYSSYVRQGDKNIILIVLNSIQFTHTPFLIPRYPNQKHDATEQLQWLKKQLQTHHAKQLIIAMHVPPGRDYQGRTLWNDSELKSFIQLLNEFSSQYGQISLLTSHTHMDDIRKLRLDNGGSIYAYATPSISRIHKNYPGIKRFDLNFELKLNDYTTYYTTQDHSWKNEHYTAINGKNNIFPQCRGKTLSQCLDTVSDDLVCDAFIKGHFYGVKNRNVNGAVCKLTYPIH